MALVSTSHTGMGSCSHVLRLLARVLSGHTCHLHPCKHRVHRCCNCECTAALACQHVFGGLHLCRQSISLEIKYQKHVNFYNKKILYKIFQYDDLHIPANMFHWKLITKLYNSHHLKKMNHTTRTIHTHLKMMRNPTHSYQLWILGWTILF